MNFKQPNSKYKAIGINIYGGGFTLGTLNHFKVLGQWEEIKLGKRTFEMNFEGLIPRPLQLKDWPVKEHMAKVDFVFANPPCAPWSQANNHKGKTRESRFEDWRLALTRSTMEAAVALRPRVFISESVEAAYNVGVAHYDQYVELWMRAGYAVTFFLTDALLHGAPCKRRRFHFCAHDVALQLGDVPVIDRPKTVRETIGDLAKDKTFGTIPLHEYRKPADEHQGYLMPFVPPGGKLQILVNKLDALGKIYEGQRPGFLMRRLIWDTVAPTMVGFDFIHPDGKRWITFREAMRLCTYPDTFMAHSAIEAVDTVLPIIGDFLAGVAKKSIIKAGNQKVEHKVVDWRPYGMKYHPSRVHGKPFEYVIPPKYA